VRVRLFAALRELAGSSWVDVDAFDVDGLVRELAQRYGPAFDRIMAVGTVVVNGETVGGDRTVEEGDEVALLPPVSGGAARPAGPVVKEASHT
jgi:MoaD family protein